MDLRFVLYEIYGPQDSPTNRYESHDGPLAHKRMGGPSPVSPRCAARGKEQARGNRSLRLSFVCTKSLHGSMRRESFQEASGQEKNSERLSNNICPVCDEACMAWQLLYVTMKLPRCEAGRCRRRSMPLAARLEHERNSLEHIW